MLRIALFSLVTLLISPLSFGATLQSISKKEFEHVFVNKTATSIGTVQSDGNFINIPFSMYMDNHGKIWATLDTNSATDIPKTDEGTYTIGKDGTLYLKWNHWFKSQRLCAHLFNAKDGYLVLGCNNVFQTVFMKNEIASGKTF